VRLKQKNTQRPLVNWGGDPHQKRGASRNSNENRALRFNTGQGQWGKKRGKFGRGKKQQHVVWGKKRHSAKQRVPKHPGGRTPGTQTKGGGGSLKKTRRPTIGCEKMVQRIIENVLGSTKRGIAPKRPK